MNRGDARRSAASIEPLSMPLLRILQMITAFSRSRVRRAWQLLTFPFFVRSEKSKGKTHWASNWNRVAENRFRLFSAMRCSWSSRAVYFIFFERLKLNTMPVIALCCTTDTPAAIYCAVCKMNGTERVQYPILSSCDVPVLRVHISHIRQKASEAKRGFTSHIFHRLKKRRIKSVSVKERRAKKYHYSWVTMVCVCLFDNLYVELPLVVEQSRVYNTAYFISLWWKCRTS